MRAIVLFSTVLVAATGCGRILPDSQFAPTGSRYGLSSAAPTTELETCRTGDDNLLPNFVGAGSMGGFNACTNAKNYFTVQLWGQVTPPDNGPASGGGAMQGLCAFPATYYPSVSGFPARYAPKIDNTGLPMFNCAGVQPDGVVSGVQFTFDSTIYDALLITRAENRDAMRNCLAMNDPRLCPPYARGRFR